MNRRTRENFDVPPEVRSVAEQSVQQARQAFEGFMTSAQRTVSTIENQADTARKNAREVGQTALAFAEHSIASSFDFAQRLVRAKDIDEMLSLQADYIKSQVHALAEQAKTVGEQSSRVAKDAARPRR